MQEWQQFVQERQVDLVGTPGNLEKEFALIEEFGTLQFSRRRPSIKGMDRDERWAPFQENRVSLSDGTEMSASRISFSSNAHSFIASQAPYSHNMHLFWQMVWEKGIDQIVMVTELAEPKGELSAAYWPEKVLENGLEVTLVDEKWLLTERKENLQIRTFRLSSDGQERQVTHYWYHNWPDQSAPSQSETILTLIELVRSHKNSSAPILVHCHGGVGRTGVFIALYHLLQCIKNGDTPPNVFEFIASMRWQRPKMVSKPSQYAFVYQTLAEVFSGYKDEQDSEFMFYGNPA